MKFLRTWAKSRAIAGQRIRLSACALCGSDRHELAFARNNLAARFDIDRRLSYSDYRLCQSCGSVFAAQRESGAGAEAYYDLFPDIEERGYAKRVVPAAARKGKIAVAKEICVALMQRQMIRPGMAVLHVRCDAGSLLAEIGATAPGSTLHGLDYFPTNLQAAREAGLNDVALLSPAGLSLPFDQKYDLIICNHIFTHSMAPSEDLALLKSALTKRGQIFFYNENDHAALFDPASEFYTRMDMISYHKQLFDAESFVRFLNAHGLRGDIAGRRKFTFAVAAYPDEQVQEEPVSARALDQTRIRVRLWSGVAAHNRYLLPFAKWVRQHKRLKWLAKAASNATAGPRKAKRKTVGAAPVQRDVAPADTAPESQQERAS